MGVISNPMPSAYKHYKPHPRTGEPIPMVLPKPNPLGIHISAEEIHVVRECIAAAIEETEKRATIWNFHKWSQIKSAVEVMKVIREKIR